MSRTLDSVLAELGLAYIARAEMMQGKRISRKRFASSETVRDYEFSDLVTYEQLQNYIALLEAERDSLDISYTQVFRDQDYVATTYRKGGV